VNIIKLRSFKEELNVEYILVVGFIRTKKHLFNLLMSLF
jgi:hypothetical protein